MLDATDIEILAANGGLQGAEWATITWETCEMTRPEEYLAQLEEMNRLTRETADALGQEDLDLEDFTARMESLRNVIDRILTEIREARAS